MKLLEIRKKLNLSQFTKLVAKELKSRFGFKGKMKDIERLALDDFKDGLSPEKSAQLVAKELKLSRK